MSIPTRQELRQWLATFEKLGQGQDLDWLQKDVQLRLSLPRTRPSDLDHQYGRTTFALQKVFKQQQQLDKETRSLLERYVEFAANDHDFALEFRDGEVTCEALFPGHNMIEEIVVHHILGSGYLSPIDLIHLEQVCSGMATARFMRETWRLLTRVVFRDALSKEVLPHACRMEAVPVTLRPLFAERQQFLWFNFGLQVLARSMRSMQACIVTAMSGTVPCKFSSLPHCFPFTKRVGRNQILTHGFSETIIAPALGLRRMLSGYSLNAFAVNIEGMATHQTTTFGSLNLSLEDLYDDAKRATLVIYPACPLRGVDLDAIAWNAELKRYEVVNRPLSRSCPVWVLDLKQCPSLEMIHARLGAFKAMCSKTDTSLPPPLDVRLPMVAMPRKGDEKASTDVVAICSIRYECVIRDGKRYIDTNLLLVYVNWHALGLGLLQSTGDLGDQVAEKLDKINISGPFSAFLGAESVRNWQYGESAVLFNTCVTYMMHHQVLPIGEMLINDKRKPATSTKRLVCDCLRDLWQWMFALKATVPPPMFAHYHPYQILAQMPHKHEMRTYDNRLVYLT